MKEPLDVEEATLGRITDPGDSFLDAGQLLQVARSGFWLLLTVAAMFMAGGAWYSYSQPPVYQADATFVANPLAQLPDNYDKVASLDTLASRVAIVNTYSQILQSRSVLETAAEGMAIRPEELGRYEVKSVVLPESNVLKLRVRGPSAVRTSALTERIGAAGMDYIGRLQGVYQLTRLDDPVTDYVPVSPKHQIDLVLSGILGIAAGLGVTVLRAAFVRPARRLSPVVQPRHSP